MSLANIETEYKLIQSWNLTYHQKANIFYPSNIKQLKNIIISLRKKNKTFTIRTGECSYDSKSIPSDENIYGTFRYRLPDPDHSLNKIRDTFSSFGFHQIY